MPIYCRSGGVLYFCPSAAEGMRRAQRISVRITGRVVAMYLLFTNGEVLFFGLVTALAPRADHRPRRRPTPDFSLDAACASSRLAGVCQMTCYVPSPVVCSPLPLWQGCLRRRSSPAAALCGRPRTSPPVRMAAATAAAVGVVVAAATPPVPSAPPSSRAPEAAPFTCRICMATVAGGTNGPAACARHPGPWLGAENGKLTGTGPANPALVRGVSYFWDCCGGGRDAPPCAVGWHEAYE